MFTTPAYAQAAGAAGPGLFEAMLPLILIFAVMYFLMIRPQQKKAKDHKVLLGSIRRGDKVVTGGGIMGTVIKVLNDNEVTVEIADKIRVRVQRSLIADVLTKTDPVKAAAAKTVGAKDEGTKGAGSMLKDLLGGKRK